MGTMARREVLGDGTFGLRPTGYVASRVLAANVAETITVPTQNGQKAALVVFQSTADFFAAYGTTASPATAIIPVDDDTGASNEMNPTQRIVTLQDNISVISSVAGCIITAAFWS